MFRHLLIYLPESRHATSNPLPDSSGLDCVADFLTRNFAKLFDKLWEALLALHTSPHYKIWKAFFEYSTVWQHLLTSPTHRERTSAGAPLARGEGVAPRARLGRATAGSGTDLKFAGRFE